MTERIVAITSIIFSTIFLVLSILAGDNIFSSVGPFTWPMGLMIMMLVLSIILTIDLFMNKESNSGEFQEEEEEEEKIVYPNKLYPLIGVFIVYIIALPYLGFLVSTFMFMTALAILFGIKKWYNIILTPVISSTVFIILFPMLLNIPFPRGVGIFQEISRLFY